MLVFELSAFFGLLSIFMLSVAHESFDYACDGGVGCMFGVQTDLIYRAFHLGELIFTSSM